MSSNIISHLNMTGWNLSEYVTAEIKAAGLAAVHKILEKRGLVLASGTKVIVSYKRQYGKTGPYQASWSLAPEALAKPMAPSDPFASVREYNLPATKPLADKPVFSEYITAEIKPVATKPVATKPVATKPVATKPVATKPVEWKEIPVAAPAFDMASAFNAMMLANEKTAKQIAALAKRMDDMDI